MNRSNEPYSLPAEIRQQMNRYRQLLLDAGMLEPTKRNTSDRHVFFYKPQTPLTAFVVNLRGNDGYIEVTYGCASTAFTRMAGDENALTEWGVDDAAITIREKLLICDEEDEKQAAFRIRAMYSGYLHMEKEELLAKAKEKRKAFIRQIADKLKPLGFRKKASTWTKELEGQHVLTFHVQKSAFSDEYYFNISLGKTGSTSVRDGYYTRVAPPGMLPMDWQALSREEFEIFLDRTVVPALERLAENPLRK